MPPQVQLLDVQVSRLGMRGALRLTEGRISCGLGGYICFSNVHTVTESVWNLGLRRALNGATLAVADGVPLLWLARGLGQPIESRVCGPDFMLKLIQSDMNRVHGLIGGQAGVAQRLATELGISAVCYSPPMRPFSEENVQEDLEAFDRSCSRVNLSPSMVWVGLGAPKQELWMATAARLRPNTLFLGVGAAFDFLSGTKSRAPEWTQRLGLEWLYRLMQEPRRLFRRYFVTNGLFVGYAISQLVRSRLD